MKKICYNFHEYLQDYVVVSIAKSTHENDEVNFKICELIYREVEWYIRQTVREFTANQLNISR